MPLDEEIKLAEAVLRTISTVPLAAKAVRLFGERIIDGESVPEALVKTSEILAAEASLDL